MQKVRKVAAAMVREEVMIRGGTVAVSGRRTWMMTKAIRRTPATTRSAIMTALSHCKRNS